MDKGILLFSLIFNLVRVRDGLEILLIFFFFLVLFLPNFFTFILFALQTWWENVDKRNNISSRETEVDCTRLESDSERGLGFEFFKLLYYIMLVYFGGKGLNLTNRSWDSMVEGENQPPQGFHFYFIFYVHLFVKFIIQMKLFLSQPTKTRHCGGDGGL